MKVAKQNADKKLTLIDVAIAAGVSAITVSRVINQPEKVSESLRQQVQKAIDLLGYIPNQYASSLASSKSNVIGVAIPSLSNTVFTDVLRGIYDVMGTTGYKVLLVDTHYSPLEEEKMIRTLLSQTPEALIITGGDQTRTCQNLIQKSRVPVVQIMELLNEPLDMNVGFSHWQAGYDVVKHLLDEGYSRIGFIGARMDPRVQQRMQGFKKALEDADKFHKNFIMTTPEPSSISVGGELFKSLLASTNGTVDAVFCANDDLALGALFESQRMNINVPNDLALCGFNDIEASRFVNPSLTSVQVGRYEMGVKAAEMVIARLNGNTDDAKVVDMGYQIKKRQSTSHE
ncbi:MAG: LacI family DNA-binding transcriptional regulator [Gammaproteobacteria bacterium]|nr:MAG: LacI family DNA-binding transcriptional regulator [Gammaproteobacteria bacterium]